ncbi:hypothetical protein [Bradyrhizobium elkanii]|uniref:hypothetical protein n=1 Tax=Bradyrhizobium elkanii TaxID=29448 RepID=UPI0010205B70|nr:hypothetical protein [Bradyrhizobium elkanii]NWL40361.1 hypothetical protein [Bradyrhizobium elkanii]RYM21105.1 hypothetical protein EWH13_28235 [Bradyrhizobium elkanii]
MSGIALKPSQRVSVVDVINPQSANAVQTSGWIDATKFHNFMAVLMVGAIGAAATVDAKLEQATSNAGAGAKDVTSRAITQLTKAGVDDNKQVLINLKQEDLDFNNGFKFFRLSMTPAVAASLIAGAVLGFDARYDFATDNDAATVDEVVG